MALSNIEFSGLLSGVAGGIIVFVATNLSMKYSRLKSLKGIIQIDLNQKKEIAMLAKKDVEKFEIEFPSIEKLDDIKFQTRIELEDDLKSLASISELFALFGGNYTKMTKAYKYLHLLLIHNPRYIFEHFKRELNVHASPLEFYKSEKNRLKKQCKSDIETFDAIIEDLTKLEDEIQNIGKIRLFILAYKS